MARIESMIVVVKNAAVFNVLVKSDWREREREREIGIGSYAIGRARSS